VSWAGSSIADADGVRRQIEEALRDEDEPSFVVKSIYRSQF
jgi:hypothetical protein